MNNSTQICPTCLQRLDPGAGYRLLSAGEIRTDGDEYYSYGMWRTMRKTWVGHRLQSNSLPTRRKIESPAVPLYPADPGDGYRLLTVGEIRKADDEAFKIGRGWGLMWRSYVGNKLKPSSAPTRRKIEAPVPGPGYKVVGCGERIHLGDEYYAEETGEWLLTSRSGETVEDGKYRRKIPVPNHDHATDSGQRACPVCSGKDAGVSPGGDHVAIKPPVLPAQVCPGFGYRLLAIGETIRKSDEALFEGHWKSFDDEGIIFDGVKFFMPRRRKIEMPPDAPVTVPNLGPGYRLLAIGEKILSSDQFYSEWTRSWVATSMEGTNVVVGFYRRLSVWIGRSVETRNVKAETTVCPGEGYRLLAPNEILEVGDEFFAEVAKAWEKFYPHTAGMTLFPGATARRKILPDPGEGYRWLKVGETIQASDEAFICGKYEAYPREHGKIFDGVEYFIPRRRKISPKYYRLLLVGELTQNTDEIWNAPSGGRPGVWMRLGWKFSVVTYSDPPVRREINSYVGGPA